MTRPSGLLPLAALLFLLSFLSPACAQRKQQALGRGVVAVQSGSDVTITWRRLAQDPENAQWNIYLKKGGGGSFTKFNDAPLTNTNYKTTTSVVPANTEVAVQMVYKYGSEQKESELSVPFTMKSQSLRNIYMEINFAGGPLNNADVSTKYVWPVDLDGNGEYDYVVDRNSVSADRHYVEAYLADGTYLWTIDLGPNEMASSGQDDQICAYDIDCDGKGEVLVQTSDGTRFWNKAGNTWGLYVNGSTTGDTDGDGIIDYNSQTTKNPPKYFTVVDGMTGAEKASVEQQYDNAYNRTNKASLMGDEYNKHVGHVGIFYPDGIHPAIVMEWHTRTTKGAHMYRNSAFAFDFDAKGNASNWHQLFMKETGGATFHQIRIFDADGDGKDEMSSGAYCMDHDGSTLYNTGISHGDRHRTSDIDPLRPGLETFSIQQDAPDMLAQILFDAATGEPIKKWYLPAVGDVGRGECLDLDKDHLGWEMFSTMDSYQIFDAKGDNIEGLTGYFPTEGIWWDGELDRERVDSPDGSGYNADIRDFRNGRLIEMGKESGYTIKSSNAKRGKFWGDIIGDWREELILNREVDGVNTGIVGFTTNHTTDVDNIYCLQEDPHYRADCTTKGYYQSPNPGFYLGYDMPRPQLPPCMVADNENAVYGIESGDATVAPAAGLHNLYLMPVKGQTLTVNNGANLNGNTTIWKSQQGKAVIACPIASTGKIVISEGTLELQDAAITTDIDLRARGTLAGSGKTGRISFEGALNQEGCRLQPQPSITIGADVAFDKKTYIELDIDNANVLNINGNVSITAPLVFNIKSAKFAPGTYALVNYTGTLSGDISNISFDGLVGLAYGVETSGNSIRLIIKEQREPYASIYWNGAESGTWDYRTSNWETGDKQPLPFVAGDGVVFDDRATTTSITADELMPVKSALFDNSTTYTINGDGGFSGECDLTKEGSGTLVLNATKSDYKGNTIIKAGTLQVKDIADKGTPSSIGTGENGTLQIGNGTLVVDNTNAATDRAIVLDGDTATVSVPSGTVSFKGQISGNGFMRKTGNGQLNITYAGSNTWNGTVLQGGTLAMGTWNTTFGTATSDMYVTSNSTIAMFDNNNTSQTPSYKNTTIIESGKTLTFKAGSRCKVEGKLLDRGTFSISFPYVRGDFYTDCSKFDGTLEVSSGQFRLRQALDLRRGTLKLGAGVYAAGYSSEKNEGSYNHNIGSLTVTAADAELSTGVWNVGYKGGDDRFDGIFNEKATINKRGSGTLTMAGNNSKGAINIYGGAVEADNFVGVLTTGNITVKEGGTLFGLGSVSNVAVENGGTIGVSKTSSTYTGVLTVNGSLTLNEGAILSVRTTSVGMKTTTDAFDVSGKVTLTSPKISINKIRDRDQYQDGTEIKVFEGSGTITVNGNITMEPAVPADGFMWDTSALATDGTIKVVADPTGIETLKADQAKDKEVYDLRGYRIATPSEGIYIVNGKKCRIIK